ncbi:hypothetical protein DYBT9275_04382 [Dyadobacter sp. CECT 9275]|uniref:Alpha-galactosidase n=1 Tax=Dyadobacter helix TaxID=2822344 RepID=A0A916JJ13_9BACT|nr:alpha-galactosidase [Dyadobacter sp. CECT 9275]CAG5008907.1 hypothetical protein DYBT9275_04382 [Dyadobacter sp. CECT 9275]
MAQGNWGILRNGNELIIQAGILERKIRMSDLVTSAVSVSGSEVAKDKGSGFSVSLWKASPNVMPMGISHTGQAGVEQSETIQDQTDALHLKTGKALVEQNVKWVDSLRVSGSSFRTIFDEYYVTVSAPYSEKKELIIRFRGSSQSGWQHLSAEVIYEIYQGFPAIRKKIRFHNNSAQWIKISHLVLDDIAVMTGVQTRTLLTPQERGVGSSIVAFSDKSFETGILVVNEIPSMLRTISDQGAAGYSSEYFEWVIGPSESFESEPVFMYAFSGKSYPTVSAVSTALDRCVEADFKRFLKKHVLLPFPSERTPAPLWCSWTNYAAGVNEGNMRQAAAIAERMGFKCFQIDAGWYDQGPGGGWAPSSRNPNLSNFPDLKSFGNYLHNKGMKLGLWVSVFRNEKQSDDLTAMPGAASLPLIRRSGGVGMSLASSWKDYYAQDLIYLHDTYGAVYFKQDLSNICYGDIAMGHDSRTLKESYLRGLRGLLAAQDKVHQSAPNVFLQLSHEIYWKTPGPPGDVAVLKHADSYHAAPNEYWGAGNRSKLVSTDWNYKPDSLSRALLKGAFRARNLLYKHRGLPLDRIEVFGAVTTNFNGSLSPKILDRQICSWMMGSPLSFSGDLTSLTDQNIAQYRLRFDAFARMQASYNIYAHFQYSGVPAPSDSDWHWWGKLNEQGHGVVVVLRGTDGLPSRKINIPWVAPHNRYRVRLSFSGRDLGFFTGKQLQQGRLELELPVLSQEVIELSEK